MGRHKKLLMEYICAACDSIKTIIRRNGKPHWYVWDGQYLCNRCYSKYVNNPIYHPRRLVFMGKRITLKENPRKGVCKMCGKKVGKEIKKTDMHHKKYDYTNPLKHTKELCSACHIKQRK